MTGILPEITASPFVQNPWKRFTNGSAETIPPFSVMRITSSTNVYGALTFTVAKPNSTTYTAYLVNGPFAVAAGADGICTTLTQAGYVAYDASDGTPAVGEEWGPENNSWETHKNVSGFFACGGVINSAGVDAMAAIQISSGDTSEIVEVYHTSGSPSNGDIVEPNASNLHPGRIRTYDGDTTYAIGDDIWIQFVDGFDGQPNVDGDVLAVQGEYYGPAKLQGTATVSAVTRPLYVLECSEREFIGKASSTIAKGASGTVRLYHSFDQTDSGIDMTCLALGAVITASKWVVVWRSAGKWFVAPWEC